MKIKKYQKPAGVLPSATTKAYLTGLKDYLFGTTKSFDESTYKPTIGAKRDKYYTRPGLKEEVVLNLLGGMDKDNQNAVNAFGEPYFYQNFDDVYNTISKTSNKILSRTASNGTLGRYAISAGNDDNGRYISFSDTFDHAIIPGKGIPIYDRIYEDEFNKLYNSNKSALREGDWISRSPILKKMLQQGGSIKYIKTESQVEIPEIQGYKKQFSIQAPQGDAVEENKSPQIIYVQAPQQQQVQAEPQEEPAPVNTTKTSKKYTNKNEFISEMTEAYSKALKLRGINPDYASYLAIQDALESGFGKSYVGNWNYGNITVGSSGASYTEGKDHDGYGKQIINKFRNYDTLDDYINNKIDLLSGRRYRAFNGDISGFYSRVKAGGYAGDPNYVAHLNKLYGQYFPLKGRKGIKLPLTADNQIPKITDTLKNGDKTFTEMCAEFQNTVLRNSGYKTSNNAWNLDNADVYMSGYDTLEKPNDYSINKVQRYNYNAANNLKQNLDVNMLDRNQVYIANMYYNGSPFQKQAYDEGKDNITGTHTGYVRFNPDTNGWEVTHNIHGTVHVDSLNNVLGSRGRYGVTALLKPQKQTIVDKIKDAGKIFGKLVYQNGPFLNK